MLQAKMVKEQVVDLADHYLKKALFPLMEFLVIEMI